MAKKTAKKKTSKKPAAKKSSKKPARKAGGKNGGASGAGAAGGGSSLAPRPINTGKGASAMEVGQQLVEMFNSMTADDKIWDAIFSPKCVSIEGLGVGMAWHGRKAMKAKSEEWMAQNEVHSARAEGPYVGATGFAVKFTVDVSDKATGQRRTMTEVAVYTVMNGKVIQEEFMYGV